MGISSFFLPEFIHNDYHQAPVTSDYYEWKTSKGLLALCLVNGLWILRLYTKSNLDGMVIRSGYTDPDQAALDANRGDFGIQEFDDLFRHIYTPSDLQQWRPFRSTYREKIATT